MLASEIDYRSELLTLCDGVNEEDLADGAGEVLLSLIEGGDGGLPLDALSCRGELMEAVSWFFEQLRRGSRSCRQRAPVLLSAVRLLWAGYFREVLV